MISVNHHQTSEVKWGASTWKTHYVYIIFRAETMGFPYLSPHAELAPRNPRIASVLGFFIPWIRGILSWSLVNRIQMSLKMFEGHVEGIGSISSPLTWIIIFYNNYINDFTDIYEIQMIFADMDWILHIPPGFQRGARGGLLTVPTRTWGNMVNYIMT